MALRQVKPGIGILLFFIAVLLILITGPLGFIFAIFHSFYRRLFKGVGAYFLQLAVVLDQVGNVMMQNLFNAVLITKGGYRFGKRKETISSAIGKNKERGTLSTAGILLSRILDFLDEDHSLNSIDYLVHPHPEEEKKDVEAA